MRVPDAVQREAKRNGAPLIRDRSRLRVRNGPGSAPQHSVLRCARDTVTTRITQLRFRVLASDAEKPEPGLIRGGRGPPDGIVLKRASSTSEGMEADDGRCKDRPLMIERPSTSDYQGGQAPELDSGRA